MAKILIVDEKQNIELMKSVLSKSGYDIDYAQTGTSALKKVDIIKPSLIIMELLLPGISGYDVCKIVKNNPETQNILVLVLTALSSRDAKTRAFELGADDFMLKPFDKDTLLSRIKALLRIETLMIELEKQYAQIKEKNRQLDLQLKMAMQVQQALVKEYNLDFNDIKISSKYKPALDVGGDFYDIVFLMGRYICIFMSDVSGHGISAALLTSMIKTMFNSGVEEDFRPEILLNSMNKQFCSIFSGVDTDVYSCAFYAIIDTENEIISYANAGHVLPIFFDASSDMVYELNIVGTPLGIMDDSKYEAKFINYNKGDMFFLYTDGLSDSYYKNSPEEFVQILSDMLIDMKEEDNNAIIQRAMDLFYNNDEEEKYKNDDVSIIVCKM